MTFQVSSVRSDDSASFRGISGVFRANILVSFEKADDPNLIYQLGFEGQIRETGSGIWRSSALLGPATTEMRFWDVEVGTEYDLRFRYLYNNGTIGDWVSSWTDYDDDGTPVTVHTSHLVQGNKQIPPDPASFTITKTISGNLLFRVTLDWVPPDLGGFEMRFFEGSTTDWEAMTWHAVFFQPYESSAFASGHYTFAVKTLNAASDMHEDPLATPPTPKLYNRSENAFFVEVDVVDPRPIFGYLFNATTPVSIDGTITTLANYAGGGVTDNATRLGVTTDEVLGTIAFPSTPTDSLYSITGTVNLDVSVGGNPPNNTNIGVYLRSSVSGDTLIGSAYLVDSHKQDLLSIIFLDLAVIVAAGATLSLGIATVGGGSGNVTVSSSLFEAEYVEAWNG